MVLTNITICFVNEAAEVSTANTQLGLIMSYHNQTYVVTPFNHDKTHFTHYNNAYFNIENTRVNLVDSRYSYPFFLRIWKLIDLNINNMGEFNINFPKRNHYYGNDNIIDNLSPLYINGWHPCLPPIFVHKITDKILDIGTAIYSKQLDIKITGIVILNYNNDSIVLSMYMLKNIIITNDYNYANLYYSIKLSRTNNNIKWLIVKDWGAYTFNVVLIQKVKIIHFSTNKK